MRNRIAQLARFLSLFLALSLATEAIASEAVRADSPNPHNGTIYNDLVGAWSYTAQGAPEGYDKGMLLIVEQGDDYAVRVQIGDQVFVGQQVRVKGRSIDFLIVIEGDNVKVSLTAKGSQMTGQSSSSEGSYAIEAVKSISAG